MILYIHRHNLYCTCVHTHTHTHSVSRGSSKTHFPPSLPVDEDSNSSWTSSAGRKKPRGHTHQGASGGNLIGRGGLGGGGREGAGSHASREVSSDSDEESGERKKKVKVTHMMHVL